MLRLSCTAICFLVFSLMAQQDPVLKVRKSKPKEVMMASIGGVFTGKISHRLFCSGELTVSPGWQVVSFSLHQDDHFSSSPEKISGNKIPRKYCLNSHELIGKTFFITEIRAFDPAGKLFVLANMNLLIDH
jgi:hypothetical protein